MGDETVLLTATCRACGKVAEVGYIHGRARVSTVGPRCLYCGSPFPKDEKTPQPRGVAGATKRKAPKRSVRRIAARTTLG